MRSSLKMAMISAGLALATQAAAQVTFYQHEEFGGGSVRVDATIPDFAPMGFNDRASSVVVESAQSAPNVPGAVVGAIIGGVLGHQVGGGRGQDVATAGGAVAGAAIGANVGRSPGGVYSQDVQRCATVPGSARPDFWDVMYYFDGLEHHMQLNGPPPPTIWVNRNGEPRM